MPRGCLQLFLKPWGDVSIEGGYGKSAVLLGIVCCEWKIIEKNFYSQTIDFPTSYVFTLFRLSRRITCNQTAALRTEILTAAL